ncbi:MAG: NAD-dependent epimerase/dehydratase family protein [Solirubrobacteraceae bacterium]
MPEPTRIFVAGASGVIGIRLVPLLVAGGHTVAGMTRTPGNASRLRELGAEPVVCDVYDADALTEAVVAFAPAIVVHQLTDLPDQVDQIPSYGERNVRIRREGTANLISAARAVGGSAVPRFLAQSVAWRLPEPAGEQVLAFERQVLDFSGVVVRYGQLYGPGTYYPDAPPPPPRVQIDEAARATVPLLDAEAGIVEVVEEV